MEDREVIAADKTTSQSLLALFYGVDPRTISFIQHPERYHHQNEQQKARRKRIRAENPPKPRKPRSKNRKKKPAPACPYAGRIAEAVDSGIGVWDIDSRLNENLSQLVRNRMEIEEQIAEVRKTQNALYKYVDIPVTPLYEGALREKEELIHMEAKDMRWLMTECGLTIKVLAAEMKGKYSERAIQSYRVGQSPVPRDVSELLRGYPRKSHIEFL